MLEIQLQRLRDVCDSYEHQERQDQEAMASRGPRSHKDPEETRAVVHGACYPGLEDSFGCKGNSE